MHEAVEETETTVSVAITGEELRAEITSAELPKQDPPDAAGTLVSVSVKYDEVGDSLVPTLSADYYDAERDRYSSYIWRNYGRLELVGTDKAARYPSFDEMHQRILDDDDRTSLYHDPSPVEGV